MKSALAEKLMSICSPGRDLSNDHNLDNTFGIDNLIEEECLEFVEKYSITDSSNILVKH